MQVIRASLARADEFDALPEPEPLPEPIAEAETTSEDSGGGICCGGRRETTGRLVREEADQSERKGSWFGRVPQIEVDDTGTGEPQRSGSWFGRKKQSPASRGVFSRRSKASPRGRGRSPGRRGRGGTSPKRRGKTPSPVKRSPRRQRSAARSLAKRSPPPAKARAAKSLASSRMVKSSEMRMGETEEQRTMRFSLEPVDSGVVAKSSGRESREARGMGPPALQDSGVRQRTGPNIRFLEGQPNLYINCEYSGLQVHHDGQSYEAKGRAVLQGPSLVVDAEDMDVNTRQACCIS